MKKIVLQFFFITLIILLLFKYNIEIKNNIENLLYYFTLNIIPSMFPIILLTNYIRYNISLNNKVVKYLGLILSFAPSNSIIATSNRELLFSSVINPLFSYSILINYFDYKIAILIILINLSINYLFLFFNLDNNIAKQNYNYSLTDIIKISTNTIINILGVIIFFNIIITIFSIFINNKLLFFIEISNGFNIISLVENNYLKNFLLIFLNSFGGLAIFMQIKSIYKDANYFLIINKFILSLIISLITYILIYSLI